MLFGFGTNGFQVSHIVVLFFPHVKIAGIN